MTHKTSPYILRDRAFTLVEILVVTGILIFMVVGIYYIIVHSRRQANVTSSKHILEQEIRLIIDHLNQDLRAAKGNSFAETFDQGSPRTGNSWNLSFQAFAGTDGSTELISYVFEGGEKNGKLFRDTGTKRQSLSKHLDECSLIPKNETNEETGGIGDFKGLVLITAKGTIMPYHDHEGVTFQQSSTVVIRDIYYSKGSRWRKTTGN